MSSSLAQRLKRILPAGKAVIAASLEGSTLRLVAARGRRVVAWVELPVNPALVAEGRIANESDLGAVVRSAGRRLGVRASRVMVALSGARSLSRVLALPSSREIRPAVAIPREARRTMGPAVDQCYLFWHTLGSDPVARQDRYYVLAVPRSYLDSMARAMVAGGLRPDVIDLKAMALARCVPGTAVVVSLEQSVLEIVVVADFCPVATYSLGFEGGMPLDEGQLAARVSEEVGRSLEGFNARNSGYGIGVGTPLYITGGHPQVGEPLASLLQAATGMAVQLPSPAVACPPGFRLQGFMANVGLLLRSRTG